LNAVVASATSTHGGARIGADYRGRVLEVRRSKVGPVNTDLDVQLAIAVCRFVGAAVSSPGRRRSHRRSGHRPDDRTGWTRHYDPHARAPESAEQATPNFGTTSSRSPSFFLDAFHDRLLERWSCIVRARTTINSSAIRLDTNDSL
jgi:hypothetical protein